MANPKYRRSRSRVRKQRAVWLGSAKAPTLVECPMCHNPHKSHHVCPTCGHYKGNHYPVNKAHQKEA